MSLQDKFEQQKLFDDKVIAHVKECNLNLQDEDTNKILSLVHRDNYLQLIYSYDFALVQCLLDFFVEKEDYDTCTVIRDTVNNHNKASGANLKFREE